MDPESERKHEEERAKAEAAFAKDPSDADALIWQGRRTAYLGRVRDAIEVFSRGVERFPEDARFLRHRGHRWITLRELDKAIEDLTRAAALIEGRPDEIEPDGLPNARNTPISTLGSNVRYHLGLAHYLKGEWAQAEAAFREDFDLACGPAGNPDRVVAAAYWLVLALHRQGRGEEAEPVLARIDPAADVIENESYRRLLLLFAGKVDAAEVTGKAEGESVEDVTLGYGLGAWHHAHGRSDDARRVWERVVARGPWMAFGRIAAEAELARQR